jgi:hypothetical protein
MWSSGSTEDHLVNAAEVHNSLRLAWCKTGNHPLCQNSSEKVKTRTIPRL